MEEDILSQLPDDTWEEAKMELIERLEDGMVEEEAWTSLKQLARDSKDIIELRVETEKLAKVYPGQENTAAWQAIEAFICAVIGNTELHSSERQSLR